MGSSSNRHQRKLDHNIYHADDVVAWSNNLWKKVPPTHPLLKIVPFSAGDLVVVLGMAVAVQTSSWNLAPHHDSTSEAFTIALSH